MNPSTSSSPRYDNFSVRLRHGTADYVGKIKLFSPNARLYLGYTVLNGMACGMVRLLFNFYALSLGFYEANLGQLLTVTNLVALLTALPAGIIGDRIGRKPTLILASLLTTTAVFVPPMSRPT